MKHNVQFQVVVYPDDDPKDAAQTWVVVEIDAPTKTEAVARFVESLQRRSRRPRG
jgi:hypothetical protein